MNKEVLTKCGYRCDLCLAYKDNINKKDERVFLSDCWYKIYGFRIPYEDIYCEGCVSCDNPKLIDQNCPVRPCVIEKQIKNCAYCNEYICDKLLQRIVSKEELENKLSVTFTPEEYEKGVQPYESKIRLDMLSDKMRKQ